MSAENGGGLLKQSYGDDEDSSAEWEKIKGWVGSQEPAKKHPIHQLIEREQRKVPGFAEGGAVEDPLLSDPASMSMLQPPGAGIIAPSVAPPSPIVQKPPISASPAPVSSLPPPISAPAPTAAPYESEAAKTLGTTPEDLKAFLEKTMKPTGGEMIGRAGATFGDALSRAGGSNANYLEQFNAQNQKEKENLAGIPEKVSAFGKEKYGLEHELQSYDPNSPFSRVTQNANRQLLKSMGATNAQVSSMPAAAINDVVTHQVELKKALATIEQTGTYQRGMLAVQEQGEKTREAEARTHEKEAEKGALEKIISGSPIPFVGPSHKEKQAGIEKLGELGGLGVNHNAAADWAQKNPHDPRAAEIFKRAKEALGGR